MTHMEQFSKPLPFTRESPIQNIDDLPVWQGQSRERILVFAPHPDDEVLGGGGVIASTLANDPTAPIRVVVATNGEASRLTAFSQRMYPFAKKSLRQLGIKRQQESLSALIYLGLHARQVEYWGFPDQGLLPIWKSYWDFAKKYRSHATGYTKNVQSENSLSKSYTSPEMVQLILNIINTFRPTTIIMPHPQDAHADHRALAHFIALAVTMYSLDRHFSPPLMLAYPVWVRARPIPTSIQLRKGQLKLPANFTRSFDSWVRVPLSPAIKNKKATALECYRSQKLSAGAVLADSAQSDNEVFDVIQPNSVFPPFTEIPIPDEAILHSSSYGTFLRWAQARLS